MRIKQALLPLFILIVISSMVFPSDNQASATTLINQLNPSPSIDSVGNPYQYFIPVISKIPGATYYVSPSGNDGNPGTINYPWRTLNKAAHSLVAGDTLYARGGVYQEAVDFKSSGTSQEYINLLAYPGETPILDGNNFNLPSDDTGTLLEITGNYIYVSGFEVRYSKYIGVLLKGEFDIANNINTHHNLHSGMRISGDYSIIEHSNVWSNDMQNYNGQYPQGDSTALTAARYPNYAIIRHNLVHGNWGIGLSTYESNGTVIEDNIVYDNYGPNVYLSDTTSVLFQRNFIYATGNMIGGGQIGIQLGDEKLYSSNISIINNIVYHTNRNLAAWRGSSGQMVNVLIANNTFVNSGEEAGVVFKYNLSFNNVRFVNNIVEQDDSLPIIYVAHDHPGLTFANNLWSTAPPPEASSPTDIVQDPLFTHSGDQFSPYWYTLTELSPAIDNAVFLSEVIDDYFSFTREAPPDIGANEFFPSP